MQVLADSSSSKTSSSTGPRHSADPHPQRPPLPLTGEVYCPRTPFAGSSSAKLPPSCLQDAAKTAHEGKMTARSPQDANLTPTWAQLGPTWAHLGPSGSHLGLILATKISILRGRGCIFWHFGDLRLMSPKMAARWSQEPPKRPQDGPKRLQEGPKWPQEAPRRAQGEPRTAPRRPQVASKSPPSRLQVAFKNHLIS